MGRGLRRHGVGPPGRADPVGLGVDELSVSIPAIPAVKAQIRSLSLARCQELAARALTLDSAAAVRALVPADDDEDPADPPVPFAKESAS